MQCPLFGPQVTLTIEWQVDAFSNADSGDASQQEPRMYPLSRFVNNSGGMRVGLPFFELDRAVAGSKNHATHQSLNGSKCWRVHFSH